MFFLIQTGVNRLTVERILLIISFSPSVLKLSSFASLSKGEHSLMQLGPPFLPLLGVISTPNHRAARLRMKAFSRSIFPQQETGCKMATVGALVSSLHEALQKQLQELSDVFNLLLWTPSLILCYLSRRLLVRSSQTHSTSTR